MMGEEKRVAYMAFQTNMYKDNVRAILLSTSLKSINKRNIDATPWEFSLFSVEEYRQAKNAKEPSYIKQVIQKAQNNSLNYIIQATYNINTEHSIKDFTSFEVGGRLKAMSIDMARSEIGKQSEEFWNQVHAYVDDNNKLNFYQFNNNPEPKINKHRIKF